MNKSSSSSADYDYVTKSGVEYTAHSMMHKGIVDMDPTKLEMLGGFEQTESGYKYVPDESNIRVMITGRDWSEKRILIYGGNSTEAAEEIFLEIIRRIREIGHKAEPIGELSITNIAVNGDFDNRLQLERILIEFEALGYNVEYEPEQFPGLISKLDEPAVTFLLFSTGKFAIQGLQSFDEIGEAIERMYQLLQKIGL